MLKSEAKEHLGSDEKIAAMLGLTRQAVQAWKARIPLGRAYQLQSLTKGRLKVKLELYRGR